MSNVASNGRKEISRLRDLSPTQWKSGLAAWLGWLFDGLDMHLYTPVALPFVALLLSQQLGRPVDTHEDIVAQHSSWIQAAFLVGWAVGGTFFGRIGDRLGRSRALALTIFTYALFTGLSFFAQAWQQLFAFRFLAALGIGGEWAVGASLLSETWPPRWRPWIAAVLQTGVNIGTLLAGLASVILLSWGKLPNRSVFLVGILPALLVLWIRWAVPEPEEWEFAKRRAAADQPRFRELFRRPARRTTVLVITVCATALSGHWAFMFWFQQQLRHLPDVATWTEADQSGLVGRALVWVMVLSIMGNFLAGWMARVMGYRRSISLLCAAYFLSMFLAYGVPRDHTATWWWLIGPGISQGVFALFTMYVPPLFPTLLRTTGAGFCYNIGRVAAAFGTVYFGSFGQAGDYRLALFYSGFLFVPAAAVALLLPEGPSEMGTAS
ncbi:MAG TPA: MFS transporter [Pirellulales bacterium]|jgi:MFS family permease|nr:MFS transporter [Pirellulales bacterium]